MKHVRSVLVVLSVCASAFAYACSDDSATGSGGTDSGAGGDDASVNTTDGSTFDDAGNVSDDSGQSTKDGSIFAVDSGDAGVVTIDATAGNVPDASGLTGEIFHYGRFVSSAVSNAGRLVFPAVTETVLPLGGTDVTAFDVSANGAKIVYASDATVKNRFDLRTATSDGSGAGLLVALKNGGRSVSLARYAPDAKNVAFVSDDATANARDVYLVSLAGGTPAVLISPARGAGTASKLNADQVVFSRDGRYVAFTGDFAADNVVQLWIYDTQTSTLTEIVSAADVGTPVGGPGGVTNPIAWDAAGRLYFTASLGTDGAPTAFRLYMATAAAGKQVVTGTLTNAEQVGSFGISPDGNTLVASITDAAGAYPYKLYTLPAGGGATTGILAAGYTFAAGNATPNPDFAKPMVFSPDGTKIAFVADYQAANADYELFVVDAQANSTPVRLFKVTPAANRDAKWIAWSLNSSRVAFTSDEGATGAGNARLFMTNDIVTPDQVLQPVITTPAGGGFVSAAPYWTP